MEVNLKYVFREKHRNKWRYRFRRGNKKITLKGQPLSSEFLGHYDELLNGQKAPPQPKNSLNWLTCKYIAHMEIMTKNKAMSPLTLKQRQSQLHRVCAMVSGTGTKLGMLPFTMPRSAVIKIRNDMGQTPGEADNTVKSLRAMYRWAMDDCELINYNPCDRVAKINKSTDGHKAWVDSDFEKYFQRHGRGSKAGLALHLEIETLARREDLINLGRANETTVDGHRALRWKQRKAPHNWITVRISEELHTELRSEACGEMIYLLTQHGRQYSVNGFGTRFAAWCNQAGVEGRLHGVRKYRAAQLANNEGTSHEIMTVLGHSSPRQGEVYTRSASRNKMADSAFEKMNREQKVPPTKKGSAPHGG